MKKYFLLFTVAFECCLAAGYSPAHGMRPDFEEEEHASTPIYSLPNEMLLRVISFLNPKDFMQFKNLSKRIYAFSTSSDVLLCENPEDVKIQILSHKSLDRLYLKVQRTPNGFNHLALGFQLLADDSDNLRALGQTSLGASRLLCLQQLILKANPLQATSFAKLMTNAKVLWKEEASKDKPITQFNYGILLLSERQFAEASCFFEKAAQNGFQLAQHTLGVSTLLAGKEEEGYQRILFGINSLEKEKRYIKSFYSSAIQNILLSLFLQSKEAAFLLGNSAFARRDYLTAEKLFLLAARNGSPRAKMGLARLCHKMGYFEEENLWLLGAAREGNIYAHIELAVSCFNANNFEEGFAYLSNARKSGDSLIHAIIAYKLAKFVIAKNNPKHPLLEEIKKDLLKSIIIDDADNSPISIAPVAPWTGKTENSPNWRRHATQNECALTLGKIADHGNRLYRNGARDVAETWWQFASHFNYPMAQSNLGVLAEERGNLEEAKAWYLKAASNGYPLALKNILGKGCEFYSTGKPEQAKEWWELAAQFDYAEAQYNLGIMARDQDNFDEALNWFMKASEQGNVLAVNSIFGIGCSLYLKEQKVIGKKCLELAAKFNQKEAQNCLGCFARDDGNFEEAKAWFIKASTNRCTDAVNNILAVGSNFYAKGNEAEAKTWFALAAKFNNTLAQYNLGCLARDKGSFEEARSWFEKAASKGYADAINNINALGVEFYLMGNEAEAKIWFILAAKFNHTVAQHNLGCLAGEKRNFEEARSWFEKAASKGHAEAIYNINALGGKFMPRENEAEAKK